MDEIFDYVDAHFDEMMEELREFCSIRSVAGDTEGLEASRKWIQARLEAAGISWERHEIEGGNALISAEAVCGKPGVAGKKPAPALLFYNHYDVVREGREELWTAPPFVPEIRDGVLYGRGVSDNKGPLLSRIQAVEAVKRVMGRLPVNVKFLFEGDEETGSPSLAGFAAEEPERFKRLTGADACLWENGRRDEAGRPWARFGVRGSVSFDLSVELANKDVHSRMGTVVPSASWRLVWALATLKGEDERITIDGFYDDVLPVTERDKEILNAFPYEEEKKRRELGLPAFLKNASGLELKKQIYMEPSLSVCGLEAGEMYNGVRGIVPHKASARISFYLVANQNPDRLEKLLRAHLNRRGFADVRIERHGGNTPVRTPMDIPFREILIRSAKKAYDAPMVIEPTALGGGPAIYFHRAWPEMPIIGVGPGNTNANHHAPDENIRLEDYRASVKHMIALLYEMGEGTRS